jgi:effector-binding domain-containing protein
MKKKLILFSILFIVLATCFIPFTPQKVIVIKASFYNTYQQLAKADNWKRWRVDLRQIQSRDSTKILEKAVANGFKISFNDFELNVIPANGYSFNIIENNNGSILEYTYSVLPQKLQDETKIIVTEKINVLSYVLNGFSNRLSSKTHITDFKNFMENASLYYGYEIIKTKVIDTDIIVLRKVVLAKNKFTEAAKNLDILKRYIAANGLKQTHPLIAQFFPKYNDSLQLNIGIPVNKKASAKSPVYFMEMPKNGNIYTLKFHGRFTDRHKAYAAMRRYISDRQIQMPTLPFEAYPNNRLPVNDTDYVNIQINFPSF